MRIICTSHRTLVTSKISSDTRFPDLPAASGIKEQIVIWLDRRRDTRHLPEIRGHTAQDGIIINNVLPRIPMWPTGFLNIST